MYSGTQRADFIVQNETFEAGFDVLHGMLEEE